MKRFLFLCLLLVAFTGFSQETDSVYHQVDVAAEFPGGHAAMQQWSRDNVVIPSGGENADIRRLLTATFIVEKDGTISHLRVNHELDPEIARQLAGTIKSMPKWTPARHNGHVVRSHCHWTMNNCL
jgi:hypothetical protein